MLRTVPIVLAVVAAFVSFGTMQHGADSSIPPAQMDVPPSYEQLSEPVTAPNDAVLKFSRAEVNTIAAPPIPEPEIAEEFNAPPSAGGIARINQIMAQYGVYAHPATQFHIGPLPLECQPAHACVVQDGLGKIDFYMLPDQITPYLVIHEIAHTNGILNECAADNFTAQYVGHSGHYC